jgi:Mce-associated membrane protein
MEGDAGTSQLNPTGNNTEADADIEAEAETDTATASEAHGDSEEQDTTSAAPFDARRNERLGRGWFAGIAAALVLLAAGIGVGGYLALRAHGESEAIARADSLAVERAKECVTATQAPDTAAMTASQSKIIECGTGDFAVQANLFSSILVEAYQAANVQVQVSDMRAAVERHHDDGSVDVLVALRTKVTNTEAANQEQGYRLRVRMAPVDGTYKVAKLDQVTS